MNKTTTPTQFLQARPEGASVPTQAHLFLLCNPDVARADKAFHILRFCALALLFEEDSKG